MSKRNYSMNQYWMNRISEWKPVLAFDGSGKQDWEAWQEEAYPMLMELLGEFPRQVGLDAEVEYSVEDGDIIRERVVFNSEEFMSVPCYVLRPREMKRDRSNAAIICSHGHHNRY